MPGQHRRLIFAPFHLPHGLEASPLCGQVKTSYAAEKGQMGQFSIYVCNIHPVSPNIEYCLASNSAAAAAIRALSARFASAAVFFFASSARFFSSSTRHADFSFGLRIWSA